MILKLAILCLMSAPAFGYYEKGLNVRYGVDPSQYGLESHIQMPKSYDEAISASFVNVTKPDDLPSAYNEIFLMCPKDNFTVCVFYDSTGYVAGLQIAIDPDYCTEVIYDWTEAGFNKWSVTSNDTTTTYWVTWQFYVSPDYLATDVASRVSRKNSTYLIQGDYYYVSGFNGSLSAIPTNSTEMTSSSNYTEQACIIGMGQHYAYNMSVNLACSVSTISTYYPMMYHGQSVGVGWMVPANCTVPTGKKDYFETLTNTTLKMVVPKGPDCFYEYGNTPGALAMHIFFIDKPTYITCMW